MSHGLYCFSVQASPKLEMDPIVYSLFGLHWTLEVISILRSVERRNSRIRTLIATPVRVIPKFAKQQLLSGTTRIDMGPHWLVLVRESDAGGMLCCRCGCCCNVMIVEYLSSWFVLLWFWLIHRVKERSSGVTSNIVESAW